MSPHVANLRKRDCLVRFWWDGEDPERDIEIYIFSDPGMKYSKNIIKVSKSKARDHWQAFIAAGYKRERAIARTHARSNRSIVTHPNVQIH